MFQHPERTSFSESSLDKKYVTTEFKPFSIKNLSVMALQALLKVFFSFANWNYFKFWYSSYLFSVEQQGESIN